MKTNFRVICLFLSMALLSCGKDEPSIPSRPISFINNATDELAIVLPYISYPDEIVYDSLIKTAENVRPIYYVGSGKCVNILANEYQVLWHCDTLTIYIVNKAVLKQYLWDTIASNQLWLQKYELSLSNLDMLHDTIPYPPTPAMKDMKMYPSYEEIMKKK